VARHNEASETEKAAHEVTISKPYYLGKFEVTQEQYQQVMGVNPSQYKGRDLPAECVWNDAREFCRKASAKTGLTVRLPTDAEWEHACRAGTRTTYYTGDAETDLDRAAWYFKNSNDTTHSVGQKTPNAWGLYDMHGNVWEWCQGFHDPYSAEASADPQGPAQGAGPVLRGGCLYDEPGLCRSARRYTPVPGMRPFSPGLRVVVGVSHRTP
jgi:formylglycine-generating enzyme required for sulfatase activity